MKTKVSSKAPRQVDVTPPLDTLVPESLRALEDPARDLPRIAKDPSAMARRSGGSLSAVGAASPLARIAGVWTSR